MRTSTRREVVKIIERKNRARPFELVRLLGISPQALHRHLMALCREGVLVKVGKPPQTEYQLVAGMRSPLSTEHRHILSEVGRILGGHPAVLLITLFGSMARREETKNSDIDFLVWLAPDESFDRQDIWNYWDRQSRHLNWNQRVSLITRKLRRDLSIDTLLLDMPEEHIVVFDRKNYFEPIRKAVIVWRIKNGSIKIRSFGGKHAWKYSTKVNRLDQINFALELKNVT